MDRKEAIEEIKSRLSCEPYLNKSKSGMYECPFCGSGTGANMTGAVKVYPTNTWYCFSCKKSGDVLDLIQNYYGTDFNGALEIAASELGIDLDHAEAAKTDFRKADREMFVHYAETPGNGAQDAIKGTADYSAYYSVCEKRLPESPTAVSYLSARGISLETAAVFHVGFDPEADPANAPGEISGYKPHPAARLIIPTAANHYIGRSIDPVKKEYAKLNPNTAKGAGEPGIFNCGVLYEDRKDVFVTEGVFDAMSFAECGAAAIALNSTSNTGKLIKQLQNKPTNTRLIICFDNDPNEKTNAKTKEAAESLHTGLNALNVFSIVFDISAYTKPGETDVNDILKRDKAVVRKIIQKAEAQADHEANRDGLTDFLEKIQTEAYKPYRTGLSFFDDLLGGGVIQQSILLLMAAPGTGKTALAQQIAEEMAARQKPVIYLNFEMSREQMLARAISGRLERKGKGRTALEVLQGYKWNDEDRKDIYAAVDEYRKKIYPYIKYNPDDVSTDLDTILNYLHTTGEKAKAAGKPAPAVFVDYLHLIRTSKGLDTQELIKQAVTGLKRYAKDYDTFVIAIVATNRASNESGKYTLGSARDSSNLEFTADYQLSLNYYDIDNGNVKPDDAEKIAELQKAKWRQMIIRVLKSRFSVPGKSAKVYFNAAHNTFYGENDWIPADKDRVPFLDMPKKAGRRR